MTTTTTTMTTTTTAVNYSKRLEGVQMNDSLEGLLKDALDAACVSSPAQPLGERSSTGSSNDDDEKNIPLRRLVPCSLTRSEARNILLEFQGKGSSSSSSRSGGASAAVPIRVLRAIATFLGDEAVERALQGGGGGGSSSIGGTKSGGVSLAFTPPPPVDDDTPERKRFRQRIERLKIRQEEVRYSKLTSNLGKVAQDDDITTKSMTYAASIGLNMIVAPLSFGTLMYFFGGALLDYFWPRQLKNEFSTDIRKLIVGVLSGVIMLFIEMLLFVIRTHELDKAVRRKARKKKNRQGPFGYYTSQTSKTFKEA